MNVTRLPVEYRVEPFVDKQAVAAVLGMSVSWVEKRATDRSFPSHLIGGRRRYRISEVVAWAEREEAA